jgi:hypothetical protein
MNENSLRLYVLPSPFDPQIGRKRGRRCATSSTRRDYAKICRYEISGRKGLALQRQIGGLRGGKLKATRDHIARHCQFWIIVGNYIKHASRRFSSYYLPYFQHQPLNSDVPLTPKPSHNMSSPLKNSEQLKVSESLWSPDGSVELNMQEDGKLAIY